MIICNVQVVVISLPEFMNKHDIIMYIYIYILTINCIYYGIIVLQNIQRYVAPFLANTKNNQSHNITYIIIIYIYIHIYDYTYVESIIHYQWFSQDNPAKCRHVVGLACVCRSAHWWNSIASHPGAAEKTA